MLTEQALAARYARAMGPSIAAQLRAQGLEFEAPQVIEAAARAYAPGALAELRALLRHHYADSPEYLSMLVEHTDANKRREKAREWLDVQVAAFLERLTADCIEITPARHRDG